MYTPHAVLEAKQTRRMIVKEALAPVRHKGEGRTVIDSGISVNKVRKGKGKLIISREEEDSTAEEAKAGTSFLTEGKASV
jgi:hypothetical protein